MKNAPIFIILLGVFAHLNTLAQTSQSSASDDWISEGLKPQWIWRADKTNNEPIYLRKTFDTPKNIQSAKLYATCDNGADVYLNGKKIGTASDWGDPIIITEAEQHLVAGQANSIAVKAKNRGGPAAFVFKLEMEYPGGKELVISDPSWKLNLFASDNWSERDFDDSTWNEKLKTWGTLGMEPWVKISCAR